MLTRLELLGEEAWRIGPIAEPVSLAEPPLGIEEGEPIRVSACATGPRYRVGRPDDDGDEVEMERFVDEGAAKAYAREHESRGHERAYFVRRAT